MTLSPSRSSLLAPARLPLLVMLVWVGVFTALRLGLALFVGTAAVPVALWPGIFLKGLMFDLAVLALTVAPVLVYEAILPGGWRGQGWHRLLRTVWLWFSLMVMLVAATSEVTFWIEFSTRFNFIAVDYLIYTQEVIGNIRQSYPIPAIMLGLATLAALLTVALRRFLLRCGTGLPWRDTGDDGDQRRGSPSSCFG